MHETLEPVEDTIEMLLCFVSQLETNATLSRYLSLGICHFALSLQQLTSLRESLFDDQIGAKSANYAPTVLGASFSCQRYR